MRLSSWFQRQTVANIWLKYRPFEEIIRTSADTDTTKTTKLFKHYGIYSLFALSNNFFCLLIDSWQLQTCIFDSYFVQNNWVTSQTQDDSVPGRKWVDQIFTTWFYYWYVLPTECNKKEYINARIFSKVVTWGHSSVQ